MVVGARIATEVPLFLSAVQCSQIFKCQPTSTYFLTSLFKRDNFDGEKSAVKDGGDLKNEHHVLSCTYKTVVLGGRLLFSSKVNL